MNKSDTIPRIKDLEGDPPKPQASTKQVPLCLTDVRNNTKPISHPRDILQM